MNKAYRRGVEEVILSSWSLIRQHLSKYDELSREGRARLSRDLRDELMNGLDMNPFLRITTKGEALSFLKRVDDDQLSILKKKITDFSTNNIGYNSLKSEISRKLPDKESSRRVHNCNYGNIHRTFDRANKSSHGPGIDYRSY